MCVPVCVWKPRPVGENYSINFFIMMIYSLTLWWCKWKGGIIFGSRGAHFWPNQPNPTTCLLFFLQKKMLVGKCWWSSELVEFAPIGDCIGWECPRCHLPTCSHHQFHHRDPHHRHHHPDPQLNPYHVRCIAGLSEQLGHGGHFCWETCYWAWWWWLLIHYLWQHM